MHDSAVNLDLHGNRFTSLDLENQGAAVGQVLVGRIKSDGLFVIWVVPASASVQAH